jgi:hypothetical protein
MKAKGIIRVTILFNPSVRTAFDILRCSAAGLDLHNFRGGVEAGLGSKSISGINATPTTYG